MVHAPFVLSCACDNRCIFCAQEGLPPPASADAPLAERLRALRAVADEVAFVGGEPTLAPELGAAVGTARAAGFARISVQTNARGLAAIGRAGELTAAGLTDVQVSIHGASAEVHDYHTGVPGSYRDLLAGVAAARAVGLEVRVVTVITRSNFRVLSAIVPALRGLGVAAWLLELPRAAGRASAAFDRVVPRLALALPFALHALDAAARLGLPSWLRGAPLCMLGPFADRAICGEPRAYGAACAACPARPRCPGVDPVYLARFGVDELAPHDAGAAAAELPAVAQRFVGIGELHLAPSPAAAHAPPAEARRAAAAMARPRPADGEVSGSAARQGGRSLDEILPDLAGPKGG